MAFNTKGVLTQLETIVSGLAGVQATYIGVPQSLGNAVCAYITLGGQRPFDKAGGLRQREMQYRVVFAYRVAGDVATAEETIADLLDALETALYADRTLGGTVESLEADFSAASEPRYVATAGMEFREYPVAVIVKQSRNYP